MTKNRFVKLQKKIGQCIMTVQYMKYNNKRIAVLVHEEFQDFGKYDQCLTLADCCKLQDFLTAAIRELETMSIKEMREIEESAKKGVSFK